MAEKEADKMLTLPQPQTHNALYIHTLLYYTEQNAQIITYCVYEEEAVLASFYGSSALKETCSLIC